MNRPRTHPRSKRNMSHRSAGYLIGFLVIVWLLGLSAAAALAAPDVPRQPPESHQPGSPSPASKRSGDGQPPPESGLSPAEVYRRTLRSTAWIVFVVQDEEGERLSSGTGWVQDAQRRLLVTNEHVVHGVDKVQAFFPEEKDGQVVTDPEYYRKEVQAASGVVIDRDSQRDLALVQLDAIPPGVRALELARQSPSPGERVFTVAALAKGSEGLWGFTTGDVRQVYRRSHANGGYARVVETQLPTNPGSSGGAVVNDRGRLVAVVEGHVIDARLVSMFIDVGEVRQYLAESLPLVEPQTAQQFVQRGVRRHNEGRYEMAIADYTEAWKRDPNDTMILVNRGWAFYKKQDFQTALADFDEAVRKTPDLGPAREGRGTAYRELGNYPRAIADLTEAVRRDPEDPGVYQRRGTAYFLDQQYEKSLADRTRAIELDPSDVDYFVQRGQCFRALRRYDEAIADFETAASLNPGSFVPFYEIGSLLGELKDYERAVAALTAAIRRDRTVAQCFNNRGLALQELGHYDDAVKDFCAAINLKPNHAPYYRRLGIVLYKANSYQLALDAFQRAVELDPHHAATYSWRGDCHRALGNAQAAKNDRRKAKQLQEEQ